MIADAPHGRPCAEDYYTPPPGDAVCPHCGGTVAGLPAATPHLLYAACALRCPTCGHGWHEMREAGPTVTRYWVPAARAEVRESA